MSSASESLRFLPFAGRSVRLPSSPAIGSTSDCLRKSRSRPASAGDWPEGLARRGDWAGPGSGRVWTVTGVMAAPPPLRDRLLFLQRVSRWPRVVRALPRARAGRGRREAASFQRHVPAGGGHVGRAGGSGAAGRVVLRGSPASATRGDPGARSVAECPPRCPPLGRGWAPAPRDPTQAQPRRVLSLGQTPRPPGPVGQPGVRVGAGFGTRLPSWILPLGPPPFPGIHPHV